MQHFILETYYYLNSIVSVMITMLILFNLVTFIVLVLLFKNYRIKTNVLSGNFRDCSSLELEIENSKHTIRILKKEVSRLKQLSIVTEQSENAVMLMDAEGNIIWVNKSFERMYEYSYHEFITTLGNNIRKTSFNPKIQERLNRCISNREAVTYEALNITRSGKRLWTHTSLIPLVNENNVLIGLVTIDSDIHKRVSAGEILINHTLSFNQKLEKISEQVDTMFDLTNVLFERIDKSQKKIDQTDQIVSYVKGISDQTKILGINASIEAHSAGNYGNGFRVIANEMVSISNRTIHSLKEINELISSVKRSSDKLGNERERSEAAINIHRHLISELRQELTEVEVAIEHLKS